MVYTITSATKLSAPTAKDAVRIAQNSLGATGTPKYLIDESLLAGVKITYGSSLLDLSLAARLDRLGRDLS